MPEKKDVHVNNLTSLRPLRGRSHAERGRDACMVVMCPAGSGLAVRVVGKISAPLLGLMRILPIAPPEPEEGLGS